MKKIKVLHQVLDPSGIGGVSSEYRALSNSKLNDKYEFHSMILSDFHSGLNLHDIVFYYKRIKEVKPDIIQIRGAAIDGLNAVLAAKITHHGKILVTVHGMYSDLVFINPIKKWLSKYVVEKLIFTLADGISCVCENASNRKFFLKYKNKMLPFVYNRIPRFDNTNEEASRNIIRYNYSIDKDAIVGLYIGRITKEKGIPILIQAINAMKEQWPDNLVFMFVGDGDYYNECKKELASFENRVIFVGSQKKVDQYYFASDFFIQPSLHENHSISILEACAAKLPCIVSDCGGNTEIVQSDIGIIIPTGSSKQLITAIRKMTDSDIREKYRKSFKTHDFSKFTDSEVDKALDSVYQKIMEL